MNEVMFDFNNEQDIQNKDFFEVGELTIKEKIGIALKFEQDYLTQKNLQIPKNATTPALTRLLRILIQPWKNDIEVYPGITAVIFNNPNGWERQKDFDWEAHAENKMSPRIETLILMNMIYDDLYQNKTQQCSIEILDENPEEHVIKMRVICGDITYTFEYDAKTEYLQEFLITLQKRPLVGDNLVLYSFDRTKDYWTSMFKIGELASLLHICKALLNPEKDAIQNIRIESALKDEREIGFYGFVTAELLLGEQFLYGDSVVDREYEIKSMYESIFAHVQKGMRFFVHIEQEGMSKRIGIHDPSLEAKKRKIEKMHKSEMRVECTSKHLYQAQGDNKIFIRCKKL